MAVEVPIKLSVQGSEQSSASVDKLRQKFDTFNKELAQNTFKRSLDTAPVNELRERFSKLGDAIGTDIQFARRLGAEIDRLDTTLDQGGVPAWLDDLEKGFKQVEVQADKTAVATERVKDVASSPVAVAGTSPRNPRVTTASGGQPVFAEAGGNLETSFSAIGGAANVLGLGGAGGAIADAGNIAGVLEQVPRLTSAIATAGAGLVAFGGAIAVFYGAIQIGKNIVDGATKPLQGFVASFPQISAQTIDLFQIIKEGTSESIQGIREETALRQELRDAQLQQLRAVSSAANEEIKNQFGGIGKTFGDLVGLDTDTLDNKIKELELDSAAAAGQVSYLNSQFVQQQIAINDYVAGLQAARDAQVELQTLVAFGTTEEIERRKQVLEIERDAAETILGDIEQKFLSAVKADAVFGKDFALVDTLEEARDIARQIAAETGANPLADTNEQLIGLLSGLAGSTPELEALRDEFIATSGEIGTFTDQIEQLDNVTKPAIATRERETASIESNKRALEQAAGLRDRLNSLILEENDLQAQEDRRVALKAETEGLQALRKAEDDAINSREKSALAAQKQAQQAEKLVSIQNESTNKRAEIDSKFMDSQLKALAEFRQKEARIVEDSNLKRLRLIEDLEADLLESVANNDVASFVQRQNQGRRELGRFDQDASIDSRRRFEDFDSGAQAAQQARDKELAQLQQHTAQKLEVERQGQVQTISIQEQFNQERQALAVARQAQDAIAAENLQQQAFIQRINRLNKEQEAVNIQLMNLDKQMVANAAIIGANAGNALLGGASQAVQRGSALFGGQRASGNAISNNTSKPFISFAAGAITDRPTVGLLGEKPGWGDITFPFNKSEGIERSLDRHLGGRGFGGGEQPIHITISGNTFSRPEDLETLKHEVIGIFTQGAKAARMRSMGANV